MGGDCTTCSTTCSTERTSSSSCSMEIGSSTTAVGSACRRPSTSSWRWTSRERSDGRETLKHLTRYDARPDVELRVALTFVSVPAVLAGVLPRVEMKGEVRVFGLAMLLTGLVASPFILRFDWREPAIRPVRAEHQAGKFKTAT